MRIIYIISLIFVLGCSSNKYKADYYVYGTEKENISLNKFQEKLNSSEILLVNTQKTDSGTIKQLLPINYESKISA